MYLSVAGLILSCQLAMYNIAIAYYIAISNYPKMCENLEIYMHTHKHTH